MWKTWSMAEEQEPVRKVAKRVVKKTVVKRPVTPPAATIRYGRPSVRTSPSAPRAAAPPSAKSAKSTSSTAKVRPARPPLAIGKKAGATGKAVGARTARAASTTFDGVKGATRRAGENVSDSIYSLRHYSLPRIEQTKAAASVGAVVGIAVVAITSLLLTIFSHLRGVSTGGGRWGSLTVVVVAFIAFALGEFLLAKWYVRQPRITSFLALCLELVIIMGFFLGVINSVWAWLIMPILGAVTFAIAHRLIAIADSSPREA